MSAELEERGEDTAGTDASPMPNSRTNGQRASSNGVDAHAVREGRTIEAKGPENLHDCTPDPPERPAKKMKRGKYISRACTSCKRRKIKCEGGDPCAQCIARNRPCVSAPRGRQHSMDDRTISGRSEAGTNASHAPGDILAHHDVVVRLVEVERKLSMMQASAHDSMTFRDHSHLPRARSVEKYHTPASTELESILEADGQTFAGELSINLAFNGIDEGVDMATKFSPSTLPEFLAGSSLQHPESLSGEDGSRKVRGWLEGILDNYGVVADESEWRRSLNIFLEEVHILYPILHPPTLWDIFDGMWENSVLWNMTNPAEREHKRLSVALVCFCLALGRCSVPTRMTDASGVRSAGWSLYSVGLLLLRVLYLFRLDATQRASRLLALAVSNAHIIGLHRQRTLDTLESGQPYLIQDNNVDTALPLDLSDEWLSRFTTTTETIADLQPEITAEVSNSPMTSIPYLLAPARGTVQCETAMASQANHGALHVLYISSSSDPELVFIGGMSAEDEESAAISGMRSEGDHNDGSSMALWSADTGVETRADMSDWRMPDLNFQPAINKGAGLCLDKNAPELSITADDANLASRRVDVFDMDRGMHNTIYDALGLNGVFDLDVDIDQAMANLCSPINMGF
ncbi:hypothetical protein NKR23_g8720 [Pleurostoma richardsiae]|uniref:Zn(2)-C6 fungal-type domain-containing protein n=1 Tax=Pleurostoma richardsiae TaxID=41990 RepID=A0AA38R5W7_9PEZI|nr:hypothetical protein NKR23_g8720 [Pleurostoma richardsiae]